MAKNQHPVTPAPQQPPPAATPAQTTAGENVSAAQIWTFWGALALAVITARVLNHLLPGIPESVIERWVMLALAAFLAVFLLKLK